jgi:hypothetical protein
MSSRVRPRRASGGLDNADLLHNIQTDPGGNDSPVSMAYDPDRTMTLLVIYLLPVGIDICAGPVLRLHCRNWLLLLTWNKTPLIHFHPRSPE